VIVTARPYQKGRPLRSARDFGCPVGRQAARHVALRLALAEPAGLWIRLSLFFIVLSENLLLSDHLSAAARAAFAGLMATMAIWERIVWLSVLITRTRRNKAMAE
jgi:hypothetical protein